MPLRNVRCTHTPWFADEFRRATGNLNGLFAGQLGHGDMDPAYYLSTGKFDEEVFAGIGWFQMVAEYLPTIGVRCYVMDGLEVISSVLPTAPWFEVPRLMEREEFIDAARAVASFMGGTRR